MLVLLFLLGFIAVALSVAILVDRTSTVLGILRGDAFYRGRPTSHWQQVIGADGADGQLRLKTFELFDDWGAAPVLRACLRHPDSDVRWPAIVLFRRCASFGDQKKEFMRLLDDPVEDVRVEAIYALARLRREALPALPRLVELADSQDVGVATAARYALWSIDANAALEAEDWTVFLSEEWGFSVQFPGEVDHDSRPAKYIDSDLHEFWAWSGPSRFTVALSFAILDDNLTVAERYDLAAQVTADALNGTVEINESVEQHGVTGSEQKIVTDRGTMRTRLFIVGDRVYQVQVVYQPQLLHPDAIKHFLDSFTITWRPGIEPAKRTRETAMPSPSAS